MGQAFKKERSAHTILSKGGRKKTENWRGADGSAAVGGDDAFATSMPPASTTKIGAEPEEGFALDIMAGGSEDEDGEERRVAKSEEKSLFSVDEVDAFTAYVVESLQASSLLNVAHMQHGTCGLWADSCVDCRYAAFVFAASVGINVRVSVSDNA